MKVHGPFFQTNNLTPVKTGTTPNIDLSVKTPGVVDNYGFVWEGNINITTPGTYIFETVSDDGSRYFNSLYSPIATATVNNDGLHAAIAATGTVNIPTAGVYPIAITFFEAGGGESMQIYWTGPGIARQLIPNSAFVAGGPPDNIAPSVPTGLWVPAITSNTITLDWNNSSDNVGVVAYDIFVNGSTTASYSSPTADVVATGLFPNTSYTFAVKARDAAGNTSALTSPVTAATTNGPQTTGLNYKYYEGTWTVLPNFNNLTPVKTGTTPNIDLSVKTPGVVDNYAFLWEGNINIPTLIPIHSRLFQMTEASSISIHFILRPATATVVMMVYMSHFAKQEP